MHYAIDIPNFGPWSDPRRVATFARQVEEAGWDGLSVWDHIVFMDGAEVADPWILLAAAAMATDRLTLMNLVAPIPRRHPWKVARETVSIDLLSSGRFILGVGIGWPTDPEFARFHQESDLRVRGDMLDEGLSVVTGLWSGEPFSFEGEHYTVDEVTFLPTPVQRPRIPIWIAGMWPGGRPFRRAARWDGVAPIGFDGGEFTQIGPDEVTAIVSYVNRHRTSDGPFDVTVAGSWLANRDIARSAARSLQTAGVTWLREAWDPRSGFGFDEWQRAILMGPPR